MKTVRQVLSEYCESKGYGTEDDSLVEALTEGKRVYSGVTDEHRWYIAQEVVNQVGDSFISFTDYIITGDNNMYDMGLSYDLENAEVVSKKTREVTEIYYD